MKITKGTISREEALSVSKDYVAFVEGDFSKFHTVNEAFEKLRRGQAVITHWEGQFIRAKVSSINNTSYQAVMGDGPVVRVSNGEYSWRVDGSHYAYPEN